MNAPLLKYEMEIRHISIDEMCEKTGISRTSWYRKCHGLTEFTHGEMQKIVNILGRDCAMDIFFPVAVTQTEHDTVT